MEYIIGFFVIFWLVPWIVGKTQDLLETRRYEIKLNNLAPQLRLLNISDLHSNLSKAKESYSKLCQHRYMIDNESEQAKTLSQYVYMIDNKSEQEKTLSQYRYVIDNESEQEKTILQYVQEEAIYRRNKRKSTEKPNKYDLMSLLDKIKCEDNERRQL